jgi:hypothetical protein
LCKNNEVFQRENFYERFFQVALCGQSLKRPIGRDQFFGVETLPKALSNANEILLMRVNGQCGQIRAAC